MKKLKEGDKEKIEDNTYDYMTQMMSPGPVPAAGSTTNGYDDNFQRANNEPI